jgi:hypothetical protein
MPAAKRYKQSMIDSLREEIRNLPPGKPPEPEFNKDEALEIMKDDFQAMLGEHVDINDIVNLLNQRGFSVKASDIKKKVAEPSTSGKSQKGRKAGTPTAHAATNPRKAKGATPTSTIVPKEATAQPSSGGFTVRPDGDDT